jgi:hypothetical protein
VSHTAFISSRVQTCSSPAWVGIEPVAWILIQSAPVLDVAAGGGDHLVDRVDHRRVADLALVGDETAGGAADRGEQRLHARDHPRTVEGPGVHHVADLRADAVHGVGVDERW